MSNICASISKWNCLRLFKTTKTSCADDMGAKTKEQQSSAPDAREMSRDEQPPPHPKGISVYCLRHLFLRDVIEAGLCEDSTIYQLENLKESAHGVIRSKGAAINCPRDGFTGAAYVDCIEGDDNVGPANRMLSYVWSYSIGDIVECLEEYCASNSMDPKRTYIWICCLCNNQHRVSNDLPFDNFHSTFRDTVVNVGHVLALMVPWESPPYLTRVWCIFELFTADASDECEIEIIMPPKHKGAILNGLQNYGNLMRALVTTDIEKAEASKEDDKTKIIELVKRDIGVTFFNNRVNVLLKNCIQQMILTAAHDHEVQTDDSSVDLEIACLYFDVGRVMQADNNYDDALLLYNKSLAVREKVLGRNHPDTAIAHNRVESVWKVKGDLEQAIIIHQKKLALRIMMLEKALLVREKVLGEEHSLTITTKNEIAKVEEELYSKVINEIT